jgi:hypothetical protein
MYHPSSSPPKYSRLNRGASEEKSDSIVPVSRVVSRDLPVVDSEGLIPISEEGAAAFVVDCPSLHVVEETALFRVGGERYQHNSGGDVSTGLFFRSTCESLLVGHERC